MCIRDSTSGFKDGNTTGDDYVYDVNGNMTVDKNKNITGIVYNHLNLPTKIIFPTGNIVYIYTASGQKIQKVVTENTTVTTTDYLGGYQYIKKTASEPVELQFFPTAEGYVKNTPVSGTNTYSYVFNYTDHLGNTRLSYAKDTTTGSLKILEENNYYPFGLKHNNYNVDNFQPGYKYKYNGKELQDELGLNEYDYGARMYDPAKGRWDVTDKKAELYFSSSPYVYASNTPVNAIDPDGNIVIFINGQHGGNGGTSDYWRNYTGKESNFMSMPNRQAFDISVMNQLGDHKALYRDGAMGGWSNTMWETNFSKSNVFSSSRVNSGYEQGKEDAKSIIANLARDKTTGEIVETIKIVTHSMGAAYGKGYVKALKEYIKTLPKEMQYQVKITLVADFDPFQAGSLKADKNIKTQQFMHEDNSNIFGMGWLANEKESGAEQVKPANNESSDHNVMSFISNVSKLSEGTYKWDGKNWVKQ